MLVQQVLQTIKLRFQNVGQKFEVRKFAVSQAGPPSIRSQLFRFGQIATLLVLDHAHDIFVDVVPIPRDVAAKLCKDFGVDRIGIGRDALRTNVVEISNNLSRAVACVLETAERALRVCFVIEAIMCDAE